MLINLQIDFIQTRNIAFPKYSVVISLQVLQYKATH